MTTLVLQFVGLAVVIMVAGTFLTRFADSISEATGLGRQLIGSILLAGATSLPELVVDVSAVRLGLADMAVGDLAGSSLFNLLILAVLDLLHRSRQKMFSRASAAHALSGLSTILMMALAAIGILISPRFAAKTFLGLGVASWSLVMAYAFAARVVFIDQRMASALPESQKAVAERRSRSVGKPAAGFLVCAIMIVLAGPFMARVAGELAQQSGLGETFVGTIFIAFSTSLPELVVSVSAVQLGAFDLAIGNIFGSNAFNMVLIVPLDLVHNGAILRDVAQMNAATLLAAILMTSVAVMGQLYHLEVRRKFVEPDAWLIMLLGFASPVILYFLS